MNLQNPLASVRTILVIDWPSRELPETLVRAGFQVIVKGGPGPEDFSAYDLIGGEIVERHIGRPPDRAEVVYSYRPLSELPDIVESALKLQAHTIWTQSGLSAPDIKDPRGCWMSGADAQAARKLVQSAGMSYVFETYIVDACRRLQTAKP
jgi:predicted CoA-binding protein